MSIHIQIEKFEGPLGLLLHLIRREEMDIFDINVHHITKQYLEYIRGMKKLDLERAGEFVSMAATLIQIKSRMLLPSYDEQGEEVVTEDPRKELVRRLLEYQKYQEAGQKLYDRPLLGRDLWARGERLKVKSDLEDEIIVEEENALFALIKSYRMAVKNMKKKTHSVFSSMQSISERICEIKHLLTVGKRRKMSELLTYEEQANIDKILITFLTMLELAKIGVISVFQNESFGELYVEAKQEIVDDAISHVDEYDNAIASVNAAESLFNKAESEAHQKEIHDEDVEDMQLDLGQAPVESVSDEVEPEEAATDDEILAEELKLESEDQQRETAADNVEAIADSLSVDVISDDLLASESFKSAEQENLGLVEVTSREDAVLEQDDMDELANVQFSSSDQSIESPSLSDKEAQVDDELMLVEQKDQENGEELS